jgi:hypothetical protein
VLRIVDLEFGDVDLDRRRDRFRLALDHHGVSDNVDGAAALDARRLVGVHRMHRDGDADHRALAKPHEVDVQRVVLHRVELKVARDDAMLHAINLKLVDRGQEPSGIDALAELGIVERNRQRRLLIAVNHSGYAARATLRPGGPLAGPRTRRRLQLLDGRHN